MRRVMVIVIVSLLSLLLIPTCKGDTSLVLEHKENFTIYTNTLEAPVGLNGSDVGYNLSSDNKLFVSWNVTKIPLLLPPIIWLLTKEQRNHFSQIIGGPSPFYGYLLKTSAWVGNFSYAITQNGTYYVVLHNINWGALDLTGPTLNVQVYNAILTIPAIPYGPKAEFTVTPETANIGQPVKFDATSSQSGWNGTNQMPITEYSWNFRDGNSTTTTTPIIYHAYTQVGEYNVTLTVTALGAIPETDTIMHSVIIVSVSVGGYSVSVREYSTALPMSLYLSALIMLSSIFVTIKRKIRTR